VVLTEYSNGVFGLIMGGSGGAKPVGCINKLIGTEGVIEVGVANNGPALRYRSFGDKEWTFPIRTAKAFTGRASSSAPLPM
jgi:hypothetical protein